MANHSMNSLSVSGDLESVKRFKAEAAKPVQAIWGAGKGEVFTQDIPDGDKNENEVIFLGSLCLPPEKVIRKGWDDAGHAWCDKNWGTYWEFFDAYIGADIDKMTGKSKGKYCMNYTFTTGHCPPTEAFKNICKDYPTLDFSLYYNEDMGGYDGRAEYRQGKFIADHESAECTTCDGSGSMDDESECPNDDCFSGWIEVPETDE